MDNSSKTFGKLTMSLLVLLAISFSALPAFGQYCSASGGGQQYISAVVVGNLVNMNTGSDGYADYTSMSTNIAVGESQVATIINGLSIAGSQCGIWVDWNADSDFDDAGETVAMSGGPASFTATVTAPGETTPGDKRMRVRIMGTGSITPCGSTTYGEVEDYTIAVVARWTGSGDANDPYQIWTAEDMNAIGASSGYWGAHFKLMANINLGGYTGTSFNIIGYYVSWNSPDNKPFTGVFDGNGHTISNFTYSSTGKSGIGLFRYIDGPSAEIKDLDLINPNVDAGGGEYARYVGSLVGYIEEGSITNCYVEGGSVSAEFYVGRLVGVNNGTISNCSSSGSISAGAVVGGLVGYNTGTIRECYSAGNVSETGTVWAYGNTGGLAASNYGTITNCYSLASISSSGSLGLGNAGGLVGSNGGQISNSYATGSVSSLEWVGGLVGWNGGTITNCYAWGSASGTTRVGGLAGGGGIIHNCYSTGSVSGNSSVGGLVGSEAMVYSSFWDIQTSGLSTSAGGTGKTNAQMKDASTYLYWGCEAAWMLNAGVDYPRLVWENASGELLDAQLSDFVAGAGTETNPYLIYTAEELNLIGLFWCEFDKHFKLMADIDLSVYTGTSFNIIGGSSAFTGVFDGNGHQISNFTYIYTGNETRRRGLFGVVEGENAEIKDLGLINPDVSARYDVAALVGLNGGVVRQCYVEGGSVAGGSGLVGSNRGTITDCYSTASVSGGSGLVGKNEGTITNCYSAGSVSGRDSVGGLVGGNDGTVTNCYSTGSVSGRNSVGGLVGGSGGTISNCYSTGSVFGTGSYVGGLVGLLSAGGISNCYSAGSVSGVSSVGGLVGLSMSGTISNCYAWGSASAAEDRVGGLVGRLKSTGTITNCYSTGSVTGTTDLGGLVGWNEGAILASFWDTQTSGRTNMCGSSQYGASGCDDDNGMTTAEMQMGSTFTSAGWDFVGETVNGTEDIWSICEGVDYPKLAWQFVIGDFDGDDDVDFMDFAMLAARWLQTDSSFWCGGGGTDLTNDGDVGFSDLKEFADNWLAGVNVAPPRRASNPNPADGKTGVSTTSDLGWTTGLGATSHDLYFGTSNPPPFQLNQTTTTFNPGTMAYYATYYWRIDEVNKWGKTTGVVWSFSTMMSPPP